MAEGTVAFQPYDPDKISFDRGARENRVRGRAIRRKTGSSLKLPTDCHECHRTEDIATIVDSAVCAKNVT